MKKLFYLITLIFFCSCATIVNKTTQKIYILSDSDSLQIFVNGDTIEKNQQLMKIKRNNRPIQIIAKKDSIQDTAYIRSKLDPLFVIGNAAIPYGAFLGYMVDMWSKEIYMYPTYNRLIYVNNNLHIEQPGLPVYISFSPRIPTFISFKNYEFNNSVISPFGFDLGGEIYFKRNYSFSGGINFTVPGKETDNSMLDKIKISSFNANILFNKRFGKTAIGMGMNLNTFNYLFQNSSNEDFSITTLGPSAEIKLRLYPDFHIVSTLHSAVLDTKANEFVWGTVFSFGIRYDFEFMNFEEKRFKQLIRKNI
jgi:hypothetical protein